MFCAAALIPLTGACGTTTPFRPSPVPTIEPLVFPAACLADPVAPAEVEVPPLPDPIERPAGAPSARTWDAWLSYQLRRTERAELAGLFYQGERDAYRHAWELTDEQLRQCVAWSRARNGH